MPIPPPPPDPSHTVAEELRTIGDFLRYATSRFAAATLVYGHGTTNAFDEAAFLILEALHLPIDKLDPFLAARLVASERRHLAELIEARIATRKPTPYLVGKAYIGDIAFHVDERVIVPRSYLGELLRSGAVAGAADAILDDADAVQCVLDLCTGSGCLAVIAAGVFPRARIDAVDLSAPALAVARRNVADSADRDRIRLLEGDLFAPVGEQRYDVILANPPYVDAEAMAALPPEYRHEPAMALDGGKDGLDLVRRILAEAPAHLTATGVLICEIGSGRARLEAQFPGLDFRWLDTELSEGEVFSLPAAAFAAEERKGDAA